MRRLGRGAVSGAILTVAGSLLLLSSLFLGWYQFTYTANGGPSTVTYYPGSSANVQCAVGTGCNYAATGTQTYQTLHLPSTGVLYAEIQYLVLVVGVLGLLATVLALGWWERPGRQKAMVLLAGVAGAFGGFAPLLLWADGPTVTRTDSVSTFSPGPWDSFSGSVVRGSTSWSWGPLDGWYFAAVGAVVLVLGALHWWWEIRHPEPAETVDAPPSPEPAAKAEVGTNPSPPGPN